MSIAPGSLVLPPCFQCGDQQDEARETTAAQRFAKVDGKKDEKLVPYSCIPNPEQRVLYATRSRSTHASLTSPSEILFRVQRKLSSSIPTESLAVHLVGSTATVLLMLHAESLFRDSLARVLHYSRWTMCYRQILNRSGTNRKDAYCSLRSIHSQPSHNKQTLHITPN